MKDITHQRNAPQKSPTKEAQRGSSRGQHRGQATDSGASSAHKSREEQQKYFRGRRTPTMNYFNRFFREKNYLAVLASPKSS